MAPPPSSQFEDPDLSDPARKGRQAGPRSLLQRLTDSLTPQRRDNRTSAEMTTLPPPTRGEAMREAHRTLRARMNSHPAARQVLPHLSAVERGLAKKGSRALMRLPVSVLRRALEQLAVLQRADESPQESQNLRVLRLRLIEAIALRNTSAGTHWPAGNGHPDPHELAPASPSDLMSVPGQSDLSSSAFDEAEQAWSAMHARGRSDGH